MKRYLIVLCGILAMPAFAETMPTLQDEYVAGNQLVAADTDESVTTEENAKTANSVIRPNTITRAATTRAVASGSQNVGRGVSGSVRPMSSRTTSTAVTRPGSSAVVSSRSNIKSNSSSTGVVRRNTSAQNDNVVARVAAIQADTASTTGDAVRVGVSSNPSSSVRASTTRASTVSTSTSTSSNSTTGLSAEELAQATDFCKSQYYDCMDNFCNVLDDNQGRCSCSPNVKNYTKTEDALKEATEQLKDVAQKIQYIGLTRDEIDTLFTNTEAEAQMAGQTDTTQLKSDLDKIKKLIVDVKSGTSSSSSDTSGLSLDLSSLLNLEFSDSGFDLTTLFDSSSSNTTSIANQRGADLYKSGAARCKTAVLDSCKTQGVDTKVIISGYDMEIDRQCIVYERSLEDANTNMRSTVRNANSVLQKARLAVAQQKNTYDLRGCVNALDSCMQDEFVCGTDYEGCLDPTGRYIVSGELVLGSQPGYFQYDVDAIGDVKGLYKVWNYSTTKNVWTTVNDVDGNLTDYVNTNVSSSAIDDTAALTDLVSYLQRKIGYYDDTNDRSVGMCVSVLNKCQDLTYDKTTKKFLYDNTVLREYLMRTLVKIKSTQDAIITDYAEGCVADVRSCLAAQGTSTTSSTYTNTLPATTVAALNACSSQIYTCTSVNSNDTLTFSPVHILTAALCGTNQVYDSSSMKCVCQTPSNTSPAISETYYWIADTSACETCPSSTTYSSTTQACETSAP